MTKKEELALKARVTALEQQVKALKSVRDEVNTLKYKIEKLTQRDIYRKENPVIRHDNDYNTIINF